ncbi:Ppx/GppA phosphatase family protein [Oceanicella sp. SM1341]|uniref:Ppx/GppA phosphatase family protein n=1 Tax=Oceanicella sp. SM1341 TaxID=1548889 RepID=UPI001E5A71D6|nr:Ppx/GppA phosphatase family protein [Oceanicella sp. SM1341]
MGLRSGISGREVDYGSRSAEESAPPDARRRERPYAALDLGTNNCRMLIAKPSGRGFSIMESISRSVALGPELEETGALSNAGMNRVLRTLHLCAGRLRRHRVERMHLVATEACRQARNGRELIRAVRRETGLTLEIIPAELEARLALISCAPLVEPGARQLLVFDIGGGSTELIWIDLSQVAPGQEREALLGLAPLRGKLHAASPLGARIVDWISVPLGVATLLQRFSDVDGDRARFALMSWYFEEMLENFRPADWGETLPEGLQIIGTSGTITTLAAAQQGLVRYNREKVDGAWLRTAEVERLVDQFLGLSHQERCRHPAIGQSRANLIISGTAILQTLLRIWPVERLRVADRGLREGLLYAMMNEDGILEDGTR